MRDPGTITRPAPGRVRLPLAVLVLAAGTFLMGTTELVVAGVLPGIATDLRVPIPTAGLMITVFALGMIVGAPGMAILTLRLPRRTTLLLSLLLFAAGHVLVAVSDQLVLILIARFVTALATGAFWTVATIVAMRLAGPDARTRAVAVVLGGGGLANVIGIPVGTFLGQLLGWHAPFWILAVGAVLLAALVARTVPADRPDQARPSIRAELGALRTGRLWLVLLACAGMTGGSFSAFTFISPLLTGRAGLPASAVPLVLIAFGVGALGGTIVSGHLGERHPLPTIAAGAVLALLSLTALALLSSEPVAAVLLFVLAAFTGLGSNPILIALAARLAAAAPTLATALCTSAFNTGTALGSGAAAAAVAASGVGAAPATGAVVAAVFLVPLLAFVVVERRGTVAGPA